MGEVDLRIAVAGVSLNNPVWTASGCCNYGRELGTLYPLRELGAIAVKGTSLHPWEGNPGRRIAETPSGMLNAIGLQNPGIDHVLQVELPWLEQQGAAVIINVVGHTVAEYVAVIQRLAEADPAPVAAVELNISCPNVREGGIEFGRDPQAAAEVTRAAARVTPWPLFVKLSPNVSDIVAFARAVADAGADGLTLINTLVGMDIDLVSGQPILGNRTGGLSGPAILPIALRMVWEVTHAVRIPVVGVGGIRSGEDAMRFLLAGAQAVQVGTAIFDDPWAPLRVRDGIAAYLRAHGHPSLQSLIDAVQWNAKRARVE